MVNKAIYYILKNDATLASLGGIKIYPTVMPEGTTAPCLVFFRDSFTPEYDKSGNVIDDSTVSVIMFSKSYTEAVDIADAVRSALELAKGEYNGITIIRSTVDKGEEGYDAESDTYFQRLTFKIRTSKI